MGKKTLILSAASLAALSLGLVGPAFAAPANDPLPDSLTMAGITLYGTVDVGYAFQSKGVPLNGASVDPLEYQAFTTTRNFTGSQSTLAENAMEQSKIGIRWEEPTGLEGVTFIGKLETAFNPLSGELSDACKSLVENAGIGTPAAPAGQTANADSSRCGQAINGVAFAGFSSKTLGAVTIGRHNALQLDALAQYDPQALSYAFSFLGYSGFNGGSGSTQAARWDNSVRYAYANPNLRVSGQYSGGGSDTGILGKAYGVDLGFTAGALSVDATYQKIDQAVNLRSSFDDTATSSSGANLTGQSAYTANNGLAAFITNDTSFNLMGKYALTLANGTPKPDKLTLYAGYSSIKKAHGDYTSGGAEDGYLINVGIDVNAAAKYDMEWLGARYAMASGWTVSAGYYHAHQNDWTIGLGPSGTQGIGCSGAGLLCAGDFDEVSLAVDRQLTKHIDVYVGANYSKVTDGLAWGYASDQGGGGSGTSGSQPQTTVTAGFRIKL